MELLIVAACTAIFYIGVLIWSKRADKLAREEMDRDDRIREERIQRHRDDGWTEAEIENDEAWRPL